MKGQELLGQTAAELMETLDDDPDETAEILEAAVIVLVKYTSPGEEGSSAIEYRFSSPVWTHQLGLAHGMIEAMHGSRRLIEEPEDDEEDA